MSLLPYAGTAAREVVRVLARELPQRKASLLEWCMLTNDAKEQLYSPTSGVLKLWHSTHRSYVGAVATRAKDLGSCSERAQRI